MASPGWYPDPADAGLQQYFDGQRWTGERRPAARGTPADSDFTRPWPEQQGPTPYRAPTAPLPAPQVPAPQVDAPQMPTPQGNAPQGNAPQGNAPQGNAPQGYAAPYPPQQYAPQPYPAQPQWAQPGWPPPPPPRKKRAPLIIGLALVLVAGLATGGYFLFRGSKPAPKLTFDGKAIDQPARALEQANSTVQSLVKSRHGASTKNTRCYYGVPVAPAADAKKTDVDHSAWCGPVLFVDGTRDREYLRFTLSSADASGGKITLTPSAQPVSGDPASIPAGLSLKSPDGETPPSGNGGLAVPAPPPAAKDVLVAADVGHESVPAAPHTAVMGSIHGGVTVTNLGRIKRFGLGDDARSAPAGQRLIAFQLAGTLSGSTRVSVNGGGPRKPPDAGVDQYVVVAVPNGARSVDLVLNDAGYRQTISLLNGRPGARNIVVLTRSHRDVRAPKSGTVRFAYSQEILFPDGSQGVTRTGTFSCSRATLDFDRPDKHVRASGPSRALLYVDLDYTVAQEPGRRFGFPPETMTFTPSGGSPIRARNVALEADHIYNIFDVPGGLTTGTLKVSGSYTAAFTNGGGSYTATITTPISVRVTFPAG